MTKRVSALRGHSLIKKAGLAGLHPFDFWQTVENYLPTPPVPTLDSVYSYRVADESLYLVRYPAKIEE